MKVAVDAAELVIGFEHPGGAPAHGHGPAAGKALASLEGCRQAWRVLGERAVSPYRADRRKRTHESTQDSATAS